MNFSITRKKQKGWDGMKWEALLGISFVAALIIRFEWRSIKPGQKKEKAAMVVITFLGWLLCCLLVQYPEMPGPGHLMHVIFKPLAKLLEK